eukprot:1139236-Pelagomonas_calceolata.AAC.6
MKANDDGDDLSCVLAYFCHSRQCSTAIVHAQILFFLDLKKEGLLAPLAEIEMPLVPVIARMEARGMCFDPTVFVRQRAPLQQRLLQLEAKACKVQIAAAAVKGMCTHRCKVYKAQIRVRHTGHTQV